MNVSEQEKSALIEAMRAELDRYIAREHVKFMRQARAELANIQGAADDEIARVQEEIGEVAWEVAERTYREHRQLAGEGVPVV